MVKEEAMTTVVAVGGDILSVSWSLLRWGDILSGGDFGPKLGDLVFVLWGDILSARD